jgi:hypothetical protein
VLPPEQVAQLHASIQQLEHIRSVRQLTALIATGTATRTLSYGHSASVQPPSEDLGTAVR